LALGIGLKVVAGGVEREDQIVHVRRLGCDQAQGNSFTAPLDRSQIAVYLAKHDPINAPEPPAESRIDSV
jgi:EAL domain-containing protein (putative c-di-GMP-specific phosphodiesterase class I)